MNVKDQSIADAKRFISPYTPKHLKFTKRLEKDFYATVKHRVAKEFEANRIPYYGGWRLYLKTFSIFIVYATLCALIFSDQFGVLGVIFLYGLLGFVMDLVGLNVAHDSLHRCFFPSQKWSRRMGYWFDFNGESSHIWMVSHNVHHHIYTNVPGFDHDIEQGFFFRFDPSTNLRPFHWWQHLYAPFLYAVSTLNWTFYSDYVWMFREIKKGNVKKNDIFWFFFFKAANILVFIILPILVLSVPWWTPVLGVVAMHMVAGLFSAIVFQTGHLVEGPIFVEPDEEGHMPFEWAKHEMLTTSNFGTDNLLLTHFIGGLNFQLEHHLFPYISHVHYPRVSKILKKTAKEFHIPYNELPSFTAAILSHFRLLKKLGRSVYYPGHKKG